MLSSATRFADVTWELVPTSQNSDWKAVTIPYEGNSVMILAGDIGGTKTNLAYFQIEGERLVPVVFESYLSQQFTSLHEVLYAMRTEHPAEITAAAFGIAGPIVNGRSKLTNLQWDVVGSEIEEQLQLPSIGLLNDLAATAYGVLHLGDQDRLMLQSGTPQPGATIAIIAAGTGLGEGALVWDGTRYRAMPSEGGHSDFAPRNELEIDLLRFMLRRYEHVSNERLVSGPGLYHLYEFFRARSQVTTPAWLAERFAQGDPPAAVSLAALEGRDENCVQALDLFVSLYGAEAGNVALKFLSTGGLFVGGGIAPKILKRIQEGPFLSSFRAKGRHAGLLGTIPVHVVLNDHIALFGAAHYAYMMQYS